MRIAVIALPEDGVAEATTLTGEVTVAPFAGAETFTAPVVGLGVVPTVMFREFLKTCPADFHACTTTK